MVKDQIIRRVLAHADFLQNDVTFLGELILGQGGMLRHIGEYINCERQIIGQQVDVITGELSACVGVHVPAYGFDLLRDVQRAARVRALEQHMFDHVGGAIDAGSLMPCADAKPDAAGHAFYAVNLVSQDP